MKTPIISKDLYLKCLGFVVKELKKESKRTRMKDRKVKEECRITAKQIYGDKLI